MKSVVDVAIAFLSMLEKQKKPPALSRQRLFGFSLLVLTSYIRPHSSQSPSRAMSFCSMRGVRRPPLCHLRRLSEWLSDLW